MTRIPLSITLEVLLDQLSWKFLCKMKCCLSIDLKVLCLFYSRLKTTAVKKLICNVLEVHVQREGAYTVVLFVDAHLYDCLDDW